MRIKNLIKLMVKTRISFTILLDCKMSKLILILKVKGHLYELSESTKKSIRTRIGNCPKINPFVVDDGYMYFLVDEELVCVELQETNGVFVLWFDGQIIEFNRSTGDCFIFSFSRNCLEYFSIGDHYENVNSQKGLYGFLYKLLIQEKISRYNKENIYSIRFFFTSNGVIGQIEKTGVNNSKPPNNCVSLHRMLCDIRTFVMNQFSTSFMRLPIIGQLQCSRQTQLSYLSSDKKHGLRLFYSSTFDRRFKSIHMILTLMERLFTMPNHLMIRFQKNVMTGFLKKMFEVIISRICLKFIQNPLGFREATDKIDDLLSIYSVRSNLVVNREPSSISTSVGEMLKIIKKRNRDTEQRRKEYFDELERIQRERIQREASVKEYRNGIEQLNAEFKKTIDCEYQLERFLEDSPHKKPRL